MTALGADPAQDAADDLRRLLMTAGLVLAAFSVGAAAQAVFVYSAPLGVASLTLRTLVNLLACAVALGLCVWMRVPQLSVTRQILTTLFIAVIVAVLRHGLQILVGIYPGPALPRTLVEVVLGAAVVILAIGLGTARMLSQARLRTQERALAEQRLRASTALAALTEEELRIRRSVAENLHGGLQGQLVMVNAQLQRILDRWENGELDDGDRAVLEQVRGELDTLREYEVRQLSHLLYPAGVDTSLAYALTRLVRRVPPQIEIDAHIDDAFEVDAEGEGEVSDATVVWRVALLRAAEEAINNALRHGGAFRIGIQLLVRGEDSGRVVLMVDDNGAGMPESSGPRHGLALSEDRLKHLGGSQRLEVSPWGGVRLIAELPVRSRESMGRSQ
ncbi:MAG: ATP-binding protein [Microbacteriaceae bacterium]